MIDFIVDEKLFSMKHTGQHRRQFLQTGVAGFFTTLFAGLPKFSFAKPDPGNGKGIVVREAEGIHILTGRRKIPITIKISKSGNGIDGISFCMEDQDPGRRMRIHKHLNNDELIFIHKGVGTLTLDEETYDVKTGDVVFIPRGTWHGLDNTGKENLMFYFQYSPAGFEEYFIENGTVAGMAVKGKTEEEYAITAKKYGMVYKEPNTVK
jgi:quercetin dioxygenase-like cupin family protein